MNDGISIYSDSPSPQLDMSMGIECIHFGFMQEVPFPNLQEPLSPNLLEVTVKRLQHLLLCHLKLIQLLYQPSQGNNKEIAPTSVYLNVNDGVGDGDDEMIEHEFEEVLQEALDELVPPVVPPPAIPNDHVAPLPVE